MSRFTDSIERNWPDYTIAPGAIRESCCVDHGPTCEHCDGHGYDYENPPHEDCKHCDGTGEAPLESMTDEDMESWDEGSFVHGVHCPCDSCGSTFGGDRYKAHAIHHEAFGPNAKRPDDVHHIDICVDCLMFHANGDEPEQWQQYPD